MVLVVSLGLAPILVWMTALQHCVLNTHEKTELSWNDEEETFEKLISWYLEIDFASSLKDSRFSLMGANEYDH